ncbi:MAG: hypothetical protein RMJ98_17550 [Myxococcales bacterium]|nr:hypothetical protein [Polyangiaceae bacterium]MDW8251101.1 hypothetical protein [Myxococcales bacterium]
MAEHLTFLEATLSAQTAEAEALRSAAREQPPTEQDMAQALPSMRLVDLFLSDLNESLRQIFVAGLSFPDPELPAALAELQERARALRVATAFERIGRLQAWLRAILAEPNLDARIPLASSAWDETQRLLAWARLYKIEHDLRVVQARMAAEAQGLKIDTEPTFPTCSISLWPVGVDLAPSGKFLVHGIAIDSGKPAVLVDHLAEYNRESPFERHAISRMFQDAIEIPRLLRSLIRLEDHPYSEKDGVLYFRPAFRTTPKLLPLSDTFRPPKLPTLTVGLGVQIPSGPFLLDVAVSWSSGRLHMGSLRGEIPIRMTPLLRFNLAKLLVREGLCRDELQACFQAKEDEIELLHVTTALDGRVYPTCDPTVFRIGREVLQARSNRVQSPGESVAALFLQVATHVLGHGKPERIAELRHQVLECKPSGVEERYRLALARMLLGVTLDPNQERPFLQDALVVLLRTAGTPVDLPRLSRVLGFPLAKTSATDLRYIDGAFAYRVLWLMIQSNLVDEFRPLLEQLYEGAYKGELQEPSVGDVCTRALLMALLAQPRVGPTARHGEGEEEDLDDEEDTEDKVVLDRGLEGWGKARDFLQAHLADLAPRKSTTKTRPLPELIELLQLGDTRAFLHGEDRLGRTVAPLKIPAEKLRHACVEALLAWCSSVDGERPRWQEAAEAADALLVIVAAGYEGFFLA